MGESFYHCTECDTLTIAYFTPTCRKCGHKGLVRFTRPLNPTFLLKQKISEAERAYNNAGITKYLKKRKE